MVDVQAAKCCACGEWRRGERLAAVVLRRKEMPKYGVQRLGVDDGCEDEMVR